MSLRSEATVGDILYENLRSIAELLIDDWDWLLVLCGDERVGKSTLGIQIGLAIAEILGRGFTLENICYDWDRLKRNMVQLPNQSPFFYSESRILSRQRLSQFNINVMNALSVCGYKNHFIMINFPEFKELDPYLKDRRIKTRVEVKSYLGQRGFAHFYARQKRDHPDRRGRTVWWDYAFTYHFDAIAQENGFDEETVRLWKAYVVRDQEEKERLLSDDTSDWRLEVVRNLRQRDDPLPFRVVAEAIGQSEATVYRLVRGWREEGFDIP